MEYYYEIEEDPTIDFPGTPTYEPFTDEELGKQIGIDDGAGIDLDYEEKSEEDHYEEYIYGKEDVDEARILGNNYCGQPPIKKRKICNDKIRVT